MNLWVFDTSPDVAGLFGSDGRDSVGVGVIVSGLDGVGNGIELAVIGFVIDTCLLDSVDSLHGDADWDTKESIIRDGIVAKRSTFSPCFTIGSFIVLLLLPF